MEEIIVIEPVHSIVEGKPIPSDKLERTRLVLEILEQMKRNCVVFYKDKPYVIETFECLMAKLHQDYEYDLALVYDAYQKPVKGAIAKAKEYINKHIKEQ